MHSWTYRARASLVLGWIRSPHSLRAQRKLCMHLTCFVMSHDSPGHHIRRKGLHLVSFYWSMSSVYKQKWLLLLLNELLKRSQNACTIPHTFYINKMRQLRSWKHFSVLIYISDSNKDSRNHRCTNKHIFILLIWLFISFCFKLSFVCGTSSSFNKNIWCTIVCIVNAD